MARPIALDDYPPDIVYKGPQGSNIGDLPVYLAANGGLRTVWQLTLEERKAIMDGARIELTFMTRSIPPTAITIEGTDFCLEVADEEMRADYGDH